jgi:hypothetical protein
MLTFLIHIASVDGSIHTKNRNRLRAETNWKEATIYHNCRFLNIYESDESYFPYLACKSNIQENGGMNKKDEMHLKNKQIAEQYYHTVQVYMNHCSLTQLCGLSREQYCIN